VEESTVCFVSLIHAVRDVIIHRSFVTGHQWASLGDDSGEHRFRLDSSALRFIPDSERPDWGVESDGAVEPYRFTEALVSNLTPILNGALGAIDWNRAFPNSEHIEKRRYEQSTFRRQFARDLKWPAAPPHF
jgi:hypothetical protein